ncbi:MAG: DUF4372 domain-containing protein [Prevotella sp.]
MQSTIKFCICTKTSSFFVQPVSFLDRNHFNYLVRKYGGDKYVKSFSCWNQLLTLMFGRLSNRESLRDLIVAINAHQKKSYHLGFGKHVSKSNLSKANQNRDYRLFEDFAYFLVDIQNVSVLWISSNWMATSMRLTQRR